MSDNGGGASLPHPSLDDLEVQMARLVHRRAKAVQYAREYITQLELSIDAINRAFDEQATKLARQIQELRGDADMPHPKVQRPAKLRHNMEGLTPEEQEHYERLRNASQL